MCAGSAKGRSRTHKIPNYPEIDKMPGMGFSPDESECALPHSVRPMALRSPAARRERNATHNECERWTGLASDAPRPCGEEQMMRLHAAHAHAHMMHMLCASSMSCHAQAANAHISDTCECARAEGLGAVALGSLAMLLARWPKAQAA